MKKSADNDIFETSVRAARGAVGGVAFISLFTNVLMLTVPIYMLQLFDRVLASGSEDTLLYLSLAALGALAVLGVLDLLRGRILARTSTWLEQRLSPVALARAVAATVEASAYSTESLRDITSIRQFIASPGLVTLFDAPWVPVYLFVIFMLHPTLGFIALGGAVLLFALAVLNELITRKPLAIANDQWVRSMRSTDAAVRNAEVIESMGMVPGILRRWHADNREALGLQENASDRAGVVLALSKFARLAVQIAMLGVGAWLVVHRELTGGAMIAGSIILSRALQPIEASIGTWKQLVSARASFRRLADFMRSSPRRNTDLALPAPAGYVRVENVSFVPPGATKPTLRGVSLAVEPGEILAIVGPSAAGKTTLARLLVGAWKPAAGVVRLDGADVYAWDRVEFGRYVGYLPQDVELFDGTVAENIARLNEVEAEQIVEAAKLANVHELILKLPHGYSTRIGVGGTILSAGQRQRIGLARALFGQPRLIVLDEPNANLDADGEVALAQAMLTARDGGAAMVFISHHQNLVQQADKMLFLRDGTVELFGPREQVLPRLVRDVGTQRPPAAVTVTEVGRR